MQIDPKPLGAGAKRNAHGRGGEVDTTGLREGEQSGLGPTSRLVKLSGARIGHEAHQDETCSPE